MRLLADTHVWYRWRVDPRKLSRSQARVLTLAERRAEAVGVSAISLWELAMLVGRGKIRVSRPLEAWLIEMAGDPLIEVIPITPQIAAESAHLGSALPGDPGVA